jgi:hypothetical protein
MIEWLHALVYILIGMVGAYAHYYKKRYVDMTTKDSLHDYCFENYPHTIYMLGALMFSEMGLSLAWSAGTTLGIAQSIGALTAGYAADSGINKASDAAP